MRNSKITWSIVAGVVLALIVGVGVAIAVSRRSSAPVAAPSGAPSPAASASAPAVAAPPAPSPGADIKGPLDLVLIGVDTRVSIPGWEPHADTIMLLHVEEDLKSAYLYSLPRDLRVEVPAYKKADFAGGRSKITEAMSRGSRIPGSKEKSVEQGYELLTKSLSAYTGIKTFHGGAVLNFAGLDKLVDQLGGIDMVIDQQVKSRHRKPDGSMRTLTGGDYIGPQAVYQPGTRRLTGWQAIDYARQRYGLPNGDYDRQRHHRQMVKAILAKAMSQGLSDPAKLGPVISALGESLVYVGGRTPFEYAYALRDLKKITMVALPGEGIGSGGNYAGEQLKAEGRDFIKALAKGKHAAYLAAHPKLVDKD
ncbi:LCP family protein [Actinoplanes sp. NEAU-A12]|uniref:LCP family protein n=1 Tax=Actinoplanes sandaracinus TaxID=3045177 RepID=A0ABT6WFL5_9ACTN|nr:LCP family protein [Actinoplanes sandaracinus]MDI6098478.1 LCP family protein [Actinoplanes sandaracinus]